MFKMMIRTGRYDNLIHNCLAALDSGSAIQHNIDVKLVENGANILPMHQVEQAATEIVEQQPDANDITNDEQICVEHTEDTMMDALEWAVMV